MDAKIECRNWGVYLDGISLHNVWFLEVDADFECERLRAATGLDYQVKALPVLMFQDNPWEMEH